eukprot:3168456-Alexandrium_andersonii.AAC.1
MDRVPPCVESPASGEPRVAVVARHRRRHCGAPQPDRARSRPAPNVYNDKRLAGAASACTGFRQSHHPAL